MVHQLNIIFYQLYSIVYQINCLETLKTIHLRVMPFLKKYCRTLILGILLFGSLWGMLTYHRKEELTGSETDAAIVGVFQSLFLLTIGYILFSWVFRLWKQYRQLKNVVPFLKKHLRTLILGVLLLSSLWGMLVYKRLGELSRLEIHDNIFGIFQLLFLLTLGYIIFSWFFNLWKQYKQLKNDKATAELALLKSKIDPHFFFNTLNNLYGLAIKKSDEAPQVILKLSEIMRYTIYEGENETVLLKDEISYLEQYIEIHKIRYKKTVDIRFTRTIDEEGISVAPLLFIMLLENAFKHGVESLTNNAYIKVELTVKNKVLTFSVENNFDLKENPQTGIGIENLKRRLQLIYPKRHQLLLNKEAPIYNAKLIIKLK